MKRLKKILKKKGYVKIRLKKIITNHLELKATINGIKGRFILDTGASNSCVGLDLIERFKLLAEESETKAAGAGATNMETQLSKNNHLVINDWQTKKLHLVLFDLSHVNIALTQHNAKKVHGIIGADILRKGKAFIDYNKNVLYLKKQKVKLKNKDMSLQKEVMEKMKEAMKAKDTVALQALRAVKSAFLLAKTETGAQEELTEEQEIKIIQKQVKQRKDSATIFMKQGREDLAEPELAEVVVLEQFLPEALTEEEIEGVVITTIDDLNAQGMQDMGKVMAVVQEELAGQAEGKIISTLVRKHLMK